MNFIKNNLKILIATLIIIVLLVINTVVNSVISSKIDEEISDFLKEIEKENIVKYENISYSFLSSKLTFDQIEYKEDEREYIQIEELELTIDRDELPSMNEIKEGNFILSLSDSEINASKIKFVDRDQLMKVEQIESSFDGKINPDEDDYNFKHLNLVLNGLEMDADDVKMELGNLELELYSNNFINLTNLFEIEELQSLNNLSIRINLDNYKIPRELSKEMDLNKFGIREIEGKRLSFEIEKDDDDLDLDFELNTQNLGNLSLEAEMDFSKSQKDPYLNLEISLDNLNDDFTKVLKTTKFEEKGQNSFEFNYDGNLMEIQKSIM